MDDDYKYNRNGSMLSTLLMGIAIGVAGALWANDDSRQRIKDKLAGFADIGKDKMKQGKKKLAEGLDTARQKLEEE